MRRGIPAPLAFLSTPSVRRATCPVALSGTELKLFLSTPSVRRATFCLRSSPPAPPISIHALREEGDHLNASGIRTSRDFYPRPP